MHGQAPTIDQTEMFIRICNGFVEKNPGKIIGMVLFYWTLNFENNN